MARLVVRGRASKPGEKLIGGRADGRSADDFDRDSLSEGIAHESEHTDDEDMAREIAMDHLAEDPEYYRKLKAMEKAHPGLVLKPSTVDPRVRRWQRATEDAPAQAQARRGTGALGAAPKPADLGALIDPKDALQWHDVPGPVPEGAVRLWRADQGESIGEVHQGQHFAAEPGGAAGYLENPGYGGPNLHAVDVAPGTVYRADGARYRQALLEEVWAGMTAEERERWGDDAEAFMDSDFGRGHLHEAMDNDNIEGPLRRRGYDWIVFEDSYPEDTVTWRALRPMPIVQEARVASTRPDIIERARAMVFARWDEDDVDPDELDEILDRENRPTQAALALMDLAPEYHSIDRVDTSRNERFLMDLVNTEIATMTKAGRLDRTRLVLRPSKTDPKVRRWQAPEHVGPDNPPGLWENGFGSTVIPAYRLLAAGPRTLYRGLREGERRMHTGRRIQCQRNTIGLIMATMLRRVGLDPEAQPTVQQFTEALAAYNATDAHPTAQYHNFASPRRTRDGWVTSPRRGVVNPDPPLWSPQDLPLFHVTPAANLDRILREGLRPAFRSKAAGGGWGSPPMRRGVYLTTDPVLYTELQGDFGPKVKLVMLQIDPKGVADTSAWASDEDYANLSGFDKHPSGWHERGTPWAISLATGGTMAYLGRISPRHIRVLQDPMTQAAEALMEARETSGSEPLRKAIDRSRLVLRQSRANPRVKRWQKPDEAPTPAAAGKRWPVHVRPEDVTPGASWALPRVSEGDGPSPWSLRVVSVDGETATVARDFRKHDGGEAVSFKWRVPVDAVPAMVHDLARSLADVEPGSGHPVVDAVLRGEGTWVGKGNDGVVYVVGDGAVKVSTRVPFHAENGSRTAQGAVDHLRGEYDAHIRLAGDPLVPPVEWVEHGGRGFLVKPWMAEADTADLAQEELEAVAASLDRMHRDGWSLGDTIQLGRLADGRLAWMDLGQVRPIDAYGIDDDGKAMDRLWSESGMEGPRMPTGVELKATEARLRRTAQVALKIAAKRGEARMLRDVAVDYLPVADARMLALDVEEAALFAQGLPEDEEQARWEEITDEAMEIWTVADKVRKAISSATPMGKAIDKARLVLRPSKKTPQVKRWQKPDVLSPQQVDVARFRDLAADPVAPIDVEVPGYGHVTLVPDRTRGDARGRQILMEGHWTACHMDAEKVIGASLRAGVVANGRTVSGAWRGTIANAILDQAPLMGFQQVLPQRDTIAGRRVTDDELAAAVSRLMATDPTVEDGEMLLPGGRSIPLSAAATRAAGHHPGRNLFVGPEEIADARFSGEAELIHTHPRGGNLSPGDVQQAVNANLRAIHAIGRDETGAAVVYTLRRTGPAWPRNAADVWESLWRQAERDASARWDRKFNAPPTTERERAIFYAAGNAILADRAARVGQQGLEHSVRPAGGVHMEKGLDDPGRRPGRVLRAVVDRLWKARRVKDQPGMALLPSETDPRVRRWQRVDQWQKKRFPTFRDAQREAEAALRRIDDGATWDKAAAGGWDPLIYAVFSAHTQRGDLVRDLPVRGGSNATVSVGVAMLPGSVAGSTTYTAVPDGSGWRRLARVVVNPYAIPWLTIATKGSRAAQMRDQIRAIYVHEFTHALDPNMWSIVDRAIEVTESIWSQRDRATNEVSTTLEFDGLKLQVMPDKGAPPPPTNNPMTPEDAIAYTNDHALVDFGRHGGRMALPRHPDEAVGRGILLVCVQHLLTMQLSQRIDAARDPYAAYLNDEVEALAHIHQIMHEAQCYLERNPSKRAVPWKRWMRKASGTYLETRAQWSRANRARMVEALDSLVGTMAKALVAGHFTPGGKWVAPYWRRAFAPRPIVPTPDLVRTAVAEDLSGVRGKLGREVGTEGVSVSTQIALGTFVAATNTPERWVRLHDPARFESAQGMVRDAVGLPGAVWLRLKHQSDGSWAVVDHDGRHRSVAAMDAGYHTGRLVLTFDGPEDATRDAIRAMGHAGHLTVRMQEHPTAWIDLQLRNEWGAPANVELLGKGGGSAAEELRPMKKAAVIRNRPGLALLPSKKNPRVRRWVRTRPTGEVLAIAVALMEPRGIYQKKMARQMIRRGLEGRWDAVRSLARSATDPADDVSEDDPRVQRLLAGVSAAVSYVQSQRAHFPLQHPVGQKEDPETIDDLEDALYDLEGDKGAQRALLSKVGGTQMTRLPAPLDVWRVELDDEVAWFDLGNRYADKLADPANWIRGLDMVELYGAADVFHQRFWEFPSILYHSTWADRVADIARSGLEARTESRGSDNRDIRDAVFTTQSEGFAEMGGYGPVTFEIDTGAMKADGFTPLVGMETPHVEQEQRESLAHLFGKNIWRDIRKDADIANSRGYDRDTVVIYDSIPVKYLSLWRGAENKKVRDLWGDLPMTKGGPVKGRPGLVLQASPQNPRVKRWQKLLADPRTNAPQAQAPADQSDDQGETAGQWMQRWGRDIDKELARSQRSWVADAQLQWKTLSGMARVAGDSRSLDKYTSAMMAYRRFRAFGAALTALDGRDSTIKRSATRARDALMAAGGVGKWAKFKKAEPAHAALLAPIVDPIVQSATVLKKTIGAKTPANLTPDMIAKAAMPEGADLSLDADGVARGADLGRWGKMNRSRRDRLTTIPDVEAPEPDRDEETLTHWGSVRENNPIVQAVSLRAGRSWIRRPDLDMETRDVDEDRFALKKGDRLRNYAQGRLQDYPREEHPYFFRGIRLSREDAEILTNKQVSRMPTPGVSAFSMDPKVADQFASMDWSGSGNEIGTVIRLRRDEIADGHVGAWRDHDNEKIGAHEILNTLPWVHVVSAEMVEHDGRSTLRLEVRAPSHEELHGAPMEKARTLRYAPGLALMPSKTDPRVMRWQRVVDRAVVRREPRFAPDASDEWRSLSEEERERQEDILDRPVSPFSFRPWNRHSAFWQSSAEERWEAATRDEGGWWGRTMRDLIEFVDVNFYDRPIAYQRALIRTAEEQVIPALQDVASEEDLYRAAQPLERMLYEIRLAGERTATFEELQREISAADNAAPMPEEVITLWNRASADLQDLIGARLDYWTEREIDDRRPDTDVIQAIVRTGDRPGQAVSREYAAKVFRSYAADRVTERRALMMQSRYGRRGDDVKTIPVMVRTASEFDEELSPDDLDAIADVLEASGPALHGVMVRRIAAATGINLSASRWSKSPKVVTAQELKEAAWLARSGAIVRRMKDKKRELEDEWVLRRTGSPLARDLYGSIMANKAWQGSPAQAAMYELIGAASNIVTRSATYASETTPIDEYDAGAKYTLEDTQDDLFQLQVDGFSLSGHHWGTAGHTNSTARAIAAGPAGSETIYEPQPDGTWKDVSVAATAAEKLRGYAYHAFAQKRLAATPSGNEWGAVWSYHRGMAVPHAAMQALADAHEKEGVARLRLTGATAFSMDPKIAEKYKSSTWTREASFEGSDPVVVIAERTPAFDRSIGFYHVDTQDSRYAYEILTALPHVRVTKIRRDPDDGVWYLNVKAEEDDEAQD